MAYGSLDHTGFTGNSSMAMISYIMLGKGQRSGPMPMPLESSKEGSMLMIKFQPYNLKALMKMHKRSIRNMVVPLIVKKLSTIKTQLYANLNVCPIVHASCLKPCKKRYGSSMKYGSSLNHQDH